MPSPAIFRTLSAGLSTGLSTGLSDARAASPSHASTPQAIPRRSQSDPRAWSCGFLTCL